MKLIKKVELQTLNIRTLTAKLLGATEDILVLLI